MTVAINGSKEVWRYVHCRMINHGGMRVGVYLFQKLEYFHECRDAHLTAKELNSKL